MRLISSKEAIEAALLIPYPLSEIGGLDVPLQNGITPGDFSAPLLDDLEGFFLLCVTSIASEAVVVAALGVNEECLTSLSAHVSFTFEILDLEATLIVCIGLLGATWTLKSEKALLDHLAEVGILLLTREHHPSSDLSK
ncbi:hypothetical protein HAX54_024253 [Datura stramonium]|uniref:Uncharacterized protein n=1 Tax=Datura stramonium TaxID=4076 RepID=A0ABS8UXY9_DATST|nr:hypothetical protein [Datura stramonium]